MSNYQVKDNHILAEYDSNGNAITQDDLNNKFKKDIEDLKENGGGGSGLSPADRETLNKVPVLESQLDETMKGIAFGKISDYEFTENYTGVTPLNVIDGIIYGFKNNTTFVKSNDEGDTWIDICNSPVGSVHSIVKTIDNEVVISGFGSVYKSTNFFNGNVTWNLKLSKSNPTGNGILPWSFDGDGRKFIVTEYSGADRSESRYVWISTDMGTTFNIVYDKFTTDPTNTSHMHGVCYDKWNDRFWVSHGHGVLRGVYYSDNNGETWIKIGGDFQPDASPTTLTATPNGIVCGSDSNVGGLYGIISGINMTMRPIARWSTNTEGVAGFALKSFYDINTEQVFVYMKSNNINDYGVFMAGTPTIGNTIWEYPVKGEVNMQYMVVTKNYIFAVSTDKKVLFKSKKPMYGGNAYDRGNLNTGHSESNSSIAIGNNVKVVSANDIVIGNNAKINEVSSGTNSIAIGSGAVSYTRGVAIGNGATNNSGDSVAIGNVSKSSGVNSISIGNGANAITGATNGICIGNGSSTYTNGIAIGNGATNPNSSSNGIAIGAGTYGGSNGIAIGNGSQSGTNQISIGQGAKASFSNTVALGDGVIGTLANQVNIGAKHIEMKVVAEPVNVPADTGRVFIRKNASNKLECCVRLGATTIVLGTEA